MPETIVEVIDAAPPRSAPTSTDTLFLVAESEKGSGGVAHEITSMDALTRIAGGRTTEGILLHDSAEAFFREGGSRFYFSRVVGPAAVKSTANAFDAVGSVVPGDVALVIAAKSEGVWGNALNFEVTVTGTDFTIIVTHDTEGELDRSGLLADRAAAVAWGVASRYVTVSLGASVEDPRAQGPTSLATGTDDRAGITNTQRQTALDVFSVNLGPGQVAEPGITASAAHTRLLTHAEARNRVALLDSVDSASASTLVAQTTALQLRADARYGQFLAPWVTVAGLVAGTTRSVPPSAVQAGILARNDNSGISPNVAAAGEQGRSLTARALTQTYSDADYKTLSDAGVTVIRDVYGAYLTYGLRSLASPAADPLWVQFPGARLMMALRAECKKVADSLLFAQIDGKGLVFERLKSAIEGVCLRAYAAGSLYGDSPEEAFRVDAGAQVNTEASQAAGEIKAAVGVRTSPGAELVYIQIARQAITQPL